MTAERDTTATPDGPDDARLRETIVAAQRGDDRALGELLEAHIAPLEAFVRLRAGPVLAERESVRDVVQSVCREVLIDLPNLEYRGDAAFRAWLFLLATRKVLDRKKFHQQERRDLRREARSLDADSTDAETLLGCYGPMASPSRVAGAREQLERVEATVARLPDAQRDAVAYSRLLGLSYRDIADRMQVSESAVRNLVSRGLATIADQLAAGENG